jgi:aspartate aminotransferase-like enzyme
MGPGPSNVAPSVLHALSLPLVGHLDPAFVQLMEEIKTMLREVFLTKNELTFPVSGTGSAGMEFCFANLIEPGDEVIIGVNGVFGSRMVDVAAPISMNYALHEALRLVLQEGLETRWRRHEQNHLALKAGLADMGLELASQAGHQLWPLNAVHVPDSVEEATVRKHLLAEFNIEIGAGLGPLKGKIWRIGLMGETSTKENVDTILQALSGILRRKAPQPVAS